MNKLPNFFIIGAPKCGTTALSEYLKKHPNVYFTEPKEPHYYNNDFSARHTYDSTTYASYFSGMQPEHQAVGEGSVFYLFSKSAVPNILREISDARFIVMLRNPIDIAYSWHAQAVHSFGETEMNFKKAWHLQEKRKLGCAIPKINRVREALWYGDLFKLGEQVRRLLKHVPKERVHFVIYDDFNNNAEQEYLKVLMFLGLDPYRPESFHRINASKGYKNLYLKIMLDIIPYIRRKFGIKINLGFGITRKLKQWNTIFQTRQPLDEIFKDEIKAYFSDDVKLLSNLLERNLYQEWGFEK